MSTETRSYLPVRPRPQPDETVSSWLVRLATVYNLKLTTFCGLLIGKRMNFCGNLDANANVDVLKSIAVRAGLDPTRPLQIGF